MYLLFVANNVGLWCGYFVRLYSQAIRRFSVCISRMPDKKARLADTFFILLHNVYRIEDAANVCKFAAFI